MRREIQRNRNIFYAVAVFDRNSGRLPFTLSLACTKPMNSTQLASSKDLQTDANDRDVMSAVQARDRRALEKLYLTYHGPLARLLSRIVGQTSVVDEIINDTFMNIWACAKEFRRESRVAAWIFGMAYRRAVQSMGLYRDRGFPPHGDRLEHRMNRLTLEERLTLALAYQMGFSIDEIAEITEVARVTVEIRMFQARTSLHPVE